MPQLHAEQHIMKLVRTPLCLDEIEKLAMAYDGHEHFSTVVKPRLLIWDAVKGHCELGHDLIWTFRWTPQHVSRNEVAISLPDARNEFHFYYSVPLMQPLKINLYLGDNTFNFFEAFPRLVQQGVITENEFLIDATLNSLPSLSLTKTSVRYPRHLLDEIALTGTLQSEPHALVEMMDCYFERFNGPLLGIIQGSTRL